MCIHAIRDLFGIPGKRESKGLLDAIKAQTEAAISPADSESGRLASEARLKKLLSGAGAGSFLNVPTLSTASVGTRTLLGQ